MLANAGVGHIEIAVVHYRDSLGIAVASAGLKIQRAVPQPPVAMFEVSIKRSGPDCVVESNSPSLG